MLKVEKVGGCVKKKHLEEPNVGHLIYSKYVYC